MIDEYVDRRRAKNYEDHMHILPCTYVDRWILARYIADRKDIYGDQVIDAADAARDSLPLCPWALFSSKFFYKIDTVVFSFVFDKYYLIID